LLAKQSAQSVISKIKDFPTVQQEVPIAVNPPGYGGKRAVAPAQGSVFVAEWSKVSIPVDAWDAAGADAAPPPPSVGQHSAGLGTSLPGLGFFCHHQILFGQLLAQHGNRTNLTIHINARINSIRAIIPYIFIF
jgi:hypothetical protein